MQRFLRRGRSILAEGTGFPDLSNPAKNKKIFDKGEQSKEKKN